MQIISLQEWDAGMKKKPRGNKKYKAKKSIGEVGGEWGRGRLDDKNDVWRFYAKRLKRLTVVWVAKLVSSWNKSKVNAQPKEKKRKKAVVSLRKKNEKNRQATIPLLFFALSPSPLLRVPFWMCIRNQNNFNFMLTAPSYYWLFDGRRRSSPRFS